MDLQNSPFPRRGEMARLIVEHARPIRSTQMLPFAQTCGRISAADVYSNNSLPNKPVSRFDGIAVRYADFATGLPDTSTWQEGREFAYGNTGIALPEGYDTVIPIEEVAVRGDGIEVRALPKCRGDLVNAVGENLREGERLIAKGEPIAPAHVGLFAAGGVAEVCVYAKPRIGIIPTGDELVEPTADLPPGKNIDTNSYMIAAYIEGWGAQPHRYPIVPDDPQAIKAALAKALKENDAAIIIAGSSLGTKDYTIAVLRGMGDVITPELAHGPGRKSSLSVVDGKAVLGVAGPPMGAQIICDLYLCVFVSALKGLPPVELSKLEVTSDDAFLPHKVDFCERVHLYRAKDGYRMRSLYAHKTTRAQMQALSNGNFYRVAGTSCAVGGKTAVELLCPIEYLPDRDLTKDILGEDVQPYA